MIFFLLGFSILFDTFYLFHINSINATIRPYDIVLTILAFRYLFDQKISINYFYASSIILIFLINVISLSYTLDLSLGVRRLLIISKFLTAFLLFQAYHEVPSYRSKSLNGFILGGIVNLFILSYQLIGKYLLDYDIVLKGGRPSGTLSEADWLGPLLVILSIIFLFGFSPFRSKSINVTFALLFMLASFLTLTRGSWICSGAVLSYLFFVGGKLKIKKKEILAVILVIVIIVSILVKLDSESAYLDELTKRLAITYVTEENDPASLTRFAEFNFSIEKLKEAPLFGYGIGSWHVLYPEGDEGREVFSSYLTIAFETGVIGLLLFFLFFRKIIVQRKYLLMSNIYKEYNFPPALIMSIFIVLFLMSIFYDAQRIMLYWYILSFISLDYRNLRKNAYNH